MSLLYKQNIRSKFCNYTQIDDFLQLDDDDFINALDNTKRLTPLYTLCVDTVGVITHHYDKSKQDNLLNYFSQNILCVEHFVEYPVNRNESISDVKVKMLEEVGKICCQRQPFRNNIGWLKQTVINANLRDDCDLAFVVDYKLRERKDL